MKETELSLERVPWADIVELRSKTSGALLSTATLMASGTILSVETAPEARRQGYGTQVMRELIDLAILHKLPAVSLYVDKVNTSAVGMYTRLGFKTYHSDRFSSEHLMAKMLR